jgi:diketogulonate reductase-like aldo/keto reductase
MKTISAGGVEIPVLGFGTWMIAGPACAAMVEHALKLGYRHIDTAAAYDNEREVGQGLKASGLARDEVFLTTKIWNDAHRSGDLQRAAEASLARLAVDHVDLLLIHWPVPDVPLAETMGALNDAKARGLTRAIGVSNFPSYMIEQAVRASKAQLATNQVEYHPFLDQTRLIETLRGYDIALTAYSPLARGRAPRDPQIQEIARAHGKTPGQVILRWILQQDAVAIPKTSNPERARENLGALDFELDASEMTLICGLKRPDGRVLDPPFAPKWD